MQVKRVTDDGVGLAFLNRSGEHLWSSVKRLRSELHIGRDYFQVLQSIAITHETRGVLLIQRNGKWLLPGNYLQVGEQSIDALAAYVGDALGITLNEPPRAIATDNAPTIAVPEAATLSLIYTAMVVDFDIRLPADSPYSETRWIVKPNDLQATTFASDFQREVASGALRTLLNKSL